MDVVTIQFIDRRVYKSTRTYWRSAGKHTHAHVRAQQCYLIIYFILFFYKAHVD